MVQTRESTSFINGKMNSRNKGARGELMWRDKLREAGFEAFRGCQNAGRDAGGGEAPDIICPSLPGLHHEVKFVEKLNIQNAMDQAVRDAKPHQIPVVAHKKKNADWLITVKAEDWLKLIKESDLVAKVDRRRMYRRPIGPKQDT